ncbi:MAG: DNA internalization-related competence protein ComEC/Rec2, partial [Alteromonadales bacterium]|nr:DNA internalization-related competence protein ComEC/Rec2 [Alteromonadales bacterium]
FVEVLDVGQGLSVLIRGQDRALLYDTGAKYPSGFNMVDSEIAPYLTSLGIKKLDHLIISHSDNDHAGGADSLVKHLTIYTRWAGEPLKSIYRYKQCQAGDFWQFGELNVAVLSPKQIGKNNNNNSCVLHISDGDVSLLLTGDIDKKQERKLLDIYGEKLHSTVLIVPHHGSRSSSSEAFIKTVNPKWAVFSAGFMNHWKFPAQEVVERYEKKGIITVNSGLSGFIRFQISAQAINMKTFREDLAPYWYHHSFLP